MLLTVSTSIPVPLPPASASPIRFNMILPNMDSMATLLRKSITDTKPTNDQRLNDDNRTRTYLKDISQCSPLLTTCSFALLLPQQSFLFLSQDHHPLHIC